MHHIRCRNRSLPYTYRNRVVVRLLLPCCSDRQNSNPYCRRCRSLQRWSSRPYNRKWFDNPSQDNTSSYRNLPVVATQSVWHSACLLSNRFRMRKCCNSSADRPSYPFQNMLYNDPALQSGNHCRQLPIHSNNILLLYRCRCCLNQHRMTMSYNPTVYLFLHRSQEFADYSNMSRCQPPSLCCIYSSVVLRFPKCNCCSQVYTYGMLRRRMSRMSHLYL